MKFGNRVDIKEIELRNVCLREGNGVIWLDDVSVKFQPGQTAFFKGEQVASNILKLAAGLLTPTLGQVLINGNDIHEMDFEEFLPYRLNLGYTFNLGGILNNRTIKENLMLPFLYHGAPIEFAEKEVQEILDLFELNRYQDYRPAGVPGVVRKLACIGRTLAVTPQVLLMDDPTSSMKPNVVKRLKSWIEERREEAPLTVLVASDHDEFFSDWNYQVYGIENGRLKTLDEPRKKVAGL
ncbi:MAG TPA: ATP-binding cassette domain-containing protein [Bdellovibrionales bacterium]|nr:ATP-binding cassette domain-containing protein [Bdellovibrionales bacterium]